MFLSSVSPELLSLVTYFPQTPSFFYRLRILPQSQHPQGNMRIRLACGEAGILFCVTFCTYLPAVHGRQADHASAINGLHISRA